MADLRHLDRVTPAQIRAARALLFWTEDRLAYEANCTAGQVHRLELADRQVAGFIPTSIPASREFGELANALSRAGIIFDDDGKTVRLKQKE